MLKHIVFDFDGVIADTYDINLSLSQEHDPTATKEDFWRIMMGMYSLNLE